LQLLALSLFPVLHTSTAGGGAYIAVVACQALLHEGALFLLTPSIGFTEECIPSTAHMRGMPSNYLSCGFSGIKAFVTQSLNQSLNQSRRLKSASTNR
jgi:hypothetical protein